MYYDFSVPVPKEKGKILFKKKGNSSYVLYEYEREYKKDKQYVIPKRSIIGRLLSDNSERMFPNENYQKYFPNAVLPEERSEAYRSCCLRIGSYVAIQKILQEYELPAMLKKRLGKDSGLFLDLVSYMIVDEENAGQYYPDYAFCHPLFSEGMRIYSDVKISRLLNSITREQSIGFLDDWNHRRDHKQRIYISYDSTNKNCQAGDVDIVEFGKAKVDKGLPIFNLGIAFDQTNRVPLFYEEYPGSITDVSQFRYMVDKVIEYDYKKIGFILDRGYFSKENIMYMDGNNYPFIIMVKGCKVLVSSIVEKNLHTFETDRDCSIRAYKVYGKTVFGRLYEDDVRDRYFHIYFNPSRQAGEREKLEQMLDKYKLMFKKHEGMEACFGKPCEEFFTLKYDRKHRFLYAEEKKDVIKKALNLCGYFCIVTSEEMTAEEALIKYKGRDISEKLFRADKSYIDSKSMRVHSSEAVSAKIFVEFVALIVRNRLYNLLKEAIIRMESDPKYMTVPAALRELEKIEMVQRSKGLYRLDHAITKKQKIILSSFGLDESIVRSKAVEIGRQLADSNFHVQTEEDDENGENEIDLYD
ncbi:transposase [Ruminobacter sp.]|uniref:IS1634 family transposase n=2 Tax=Ruminobacter sp. TaxID=2774296 RepID=UPI00386EE98E